MSNIGETCDTLDYPYMLANKFRFQTKLKFVWNFCTPKVKQLISKPNQIRFENVRIFLAVQNISIGDLVTD